MTAAGNPWLRRRPLNIAHQGGAAEGPANTLYAMTRAVDAGAHTLELDVHATADGHLVVIHDHTVDATTDGTGPVDAMTLADLQHLDAAFRFVAGRGAEADAPARAYPYRGIATGHRPPPPGVDPADFGVPRLAEVLRRFPDRYVNIDIKRTEPATRGYEGALARLLADHGRSGDVIVASFHDDALARFKAYAPEVSTAAGPAEVAGFWADVHDGRPTGLPGHHALQVPPTYGDVTVVTGDFVTAAHAHALAVHVWTINEPAEMRRLLRVGVDGVVTDRPALLAQVIAN